MAGSENTTEARGGALALQMKPRVNWSQGSSEIESSVGSPNGEEFGDVCALSQSPKAHRAQEGRGSGPPERRPGKRASIKAGGRTGIFHCRRQIYLYEAQQSQLRSLLGNAVISPRLLYILTISFAMKQDASTHMPFSLEEKCCTNFVWHCSPSVLGHEMFQKGKKKIRNLPAVPRVTPVHSPFLRRVSSLLIRIDK